jgi:tRNA threonylcarbamoyladenosine biosynthesis protein TsaB
VIVLAIESATELAGVALADGSGVLATATVAGGRRHAESIVPAIDFVCRSAGVALGDVGAVVVDVGPGLFTGLRVGVGTAKALAFALGVPLVGVGSLEVLAHGAAATAPSGALLVAVVDARRAEVFVARFRATDGAARRVGEDERRTPDALADELAALGEPFTLVGNGARRYAAVLGVVPGAIVAGESLDHPAPHALAVLGRDRAASGASDDGTDVLPRYLRDADTRINWERRAGRADAAPTAPGDAAPTAPGDAAPPAPGDAALSAPGDAALSARAVRGS